jgi:GNAT superfamily N-acetyltransferase
LLLERLVDQHDLSLFDSGEPELDHWLRATARTADSRGLACTHVWSDAGVVMAYASVVMATLITADVPPKLARGKPDKIPAVLVGKLALDRSLHGQGRGTDLLIQSLAVAAAASELAAAAFVVVDALHDRALRFYQHHGFEAVAGTSRAVLPMKRVHATLSAPPAA